ncbi:hypothetical protein QOZ91_001296 [Clostridium sardiniense]|nr:hypothetical protein [Clostridium sardiniense]
MNKENIMSEEEVKKYENIEINDELVKKISVRKLYNKI